MSIECKVLNRWVRDNKDRKNFKDPVTAKEWSELLKDFTVGARHTAANLACHNWDVTIIGDRLLMHSHWSKGKWYDKGSNTPVPMTDEEWAVLHSAPADRYGMSPDPNFQLLVDFLQAREASSVPSTHQLCAKCGCETKGEAALVDGKIWCHPCADLAPSTPEKCRYPACECGDGFHVLPEATSEVTATHGKGAA